MPTRPMLLILAGLAALPAPALAVCPTNFAGGFGGGQESQVQSDAATWSGSVLGGTFALDLVAGTTQLAGSGGGGEQSVSSFLQATDLYRLVGPAGADPIPFEVRAHLTGGVTADLQEYPFLGLVCDGASVRFAITAGASSASFTDRNSTQPCAGKSIVAELALPLARVPGEPFPIQFTLQTGSNGGAGTIRGEISFAGLPPGYHVESCQGYVGQPVATLPTSWGRLKQAYR